MTLHELTVKIGTDTKELNTLVGDIRGVMGRAQQVMQQFGTRATAALTAPLVLFGKQALTASGDFQSGMNMVRVLTGATGQQFDDLRDRAKDLGASTVFSAVQVTEAMNFMAMAGMEADEIYDSLETTLNLAAAAGLEMGEAADIVTNILTGFSLPVDQLEGAVDVLTTTFTKANTDLRQLGQAFKFAGPTAKAAGMSFEETSAILGLMGKAGIQASMAGTSLRGALSRLLNPTASIKKALNEMGVITHDSSGELLSMVAIIKQFETANASAGQVLEVFGQRAGPAFTNLIGQGSEALADFIDILENDLVSTADVANARMEGFNGAMIRMKSATEGLFIAIGDSGLLDVMTDLVTRLGSILQSMAKANPELIQMAVVFGAVAASIGPVVLIVSQLLNPVGATIAAIAALTAGLVAFRGEGDSIASALSSRFGPAIEAAKNLFESVKESVAGFADRIRSFAEPVFKRFAASVGNAADGLIKLFAHWLGKVQEFWDRWGSLITSVGINAFMQVVDVVSTGVGVILDLFGILADVLSGDFTSAWEGIKDVVMDVFGFAARFSLRGADTILAALESITGFMPGFNQQIKNARSFVQALLDNDVINRVEQGADGIIEAAESASEGVTEAVDEMTKKTETDLDQILDLLDDTTDAFQDLRAELEEDIKVQANIDAFFSTDPVEAARNQVDILTNAMTEAFEQGASPGDAIVEDIAKKLEAAQDVFGDAAKAAFKGIEPVTAEDIIIETGSLDLGPALEIEKHVLDLSDNIEKGMGDAAAAFGDGLARMATEGASFGSVLGSIGSVVLGTLADMAIKTGRVAVGTGMAISGIKKALQSLNPIVAIGAGIALIALGNFVKSSLSSIASGGSPGGGGGDAGISGFGGGGAAVSAENGVNPVSFGVASARDPRQAFLEELRHENERLFNMIADQFPDELVAKVRGNDIFFIARRGEQRNNRTRGANSSGVRGGR